MRRAEAVCCLGLDGLDASEQNVFMLRFGRGAIDVASRTVEFEGSAQHLEPQAFDVLAYLVEHRDRVVPKEELLDELWGDQFVSESALATRIKEVRRALGDDGVRQEVVKNFRGRGYRFVAPIDSIDRDHAAALRPALATSLLGRDEDIEGVALLLGTSRLVTLVGPAGVGKTSLAREVALRRRGLHIDGGAFVGLAAVRDPGAIAHLLRRETGLVQTGPDEADLIATIADLDALVVLDNCEHVIDEISRLTAAIMSSAGRVRFLATSRERLGVPGEQVWPVAPLDLSTARQLLFDRARSVQPTFAWPTDSGGTVDGLLESLDRLPLAIEMAAARLPAIGIDDLSDLLANRLDLLRSTDRTADDRHRTIGNLIDWSEALLDDQDRKLLTVLSAFAGPVPAVDIAAVATLDADEMSVGPLATLVDHSLVVADTVQQPTMYRLLETVRATAGKRRSPGIEARHANHIIDVVIEMDGLLRTSDEASAAQRLDALHDEIRVAHRWARDADPRRAGHLTTALIHYAHERQWTEPAAWAESLATLVDPSDAAALAAAAACAAHHSNTGNFAEAQQLAEHALSSRDVRVVSSAHDTLTNIGMYTGDLDAALTHGSTLRSLGDDHDDSTIRTLGLLGEILALTYAGRVDEAQHVLELDDPAISRSPTSLAWVSYGQGEVLAALGSDRDAITQFDDAIERGRTVGNQFVVSVAQVSALAARTRIGDLAEARTAFVPVLAHYRKIRSMTHATTALRNLVELLVNAREFETAIVLFGALSNPSVKTTYGIESEKLTAAWDAVVQHVDPHTMETWTKAGSRYDLIGALDYAIAQLEVAEPPGR